MYKFFHPCPSAQELATTQSLCGEALELSNQGSTGEKPTIADVWSGCGDSVNIRVNTAMTAKGQGMATVDSFDLAHRGLVYHIKYRTCRKN
ncbi:DUF4360 domain-containing protein [Nostoc sp. LEGE 12447]|uniref:DUF4360 domain-containing protein n=1 Tax=Nostoc sp. LEGE 12447 TaxID=1828640 RepID=UPI001D13BA58|nr:DUF4360 domain-containing protein [Nostoc sp. LEGE 12447]